MPLVTTPIINPDGSMNITWYRFFQAIYKITGLGTPGIGVTGARTVDGEVAQHSPAFVVKPFAHPTKSELIVVDQITGAGIGLINMDLYP